MANEDDTPPPSDDLINQDKPIDLDEINKDPTSVRKDYSAGKFLHECFTDPKTVVAPDSGRIGDVRNQLIVDGPHPKDGLKPYTKRVVDEATGVLTNKTMQSSSVG